MKRVEFAAEAEKGAKLGFKTHKLKTQLLEYRENCPFNDKRC